VFWQIRSFPTCVNHVFLSHSREDHDGLVLPVYKRLDSLGIASWIDRHDYPYGRDSRMALQNSILTCRHTIFFITEQMVANPRGWCVLELAYSEILQDNLAVTGGSLSHVILPLFFVPVDSSPVSRSVWKRVQDRGPYFEAVKSKDRVEWAVSEIVAFLSREELYATQMKNAIRSDPGILDPVKSDTGIKRRVSRFDPHPVPKSNK
jgi:TIR domain